MKRIKKNKSQIATIIVFIIGVIFLFTLISINLSRIAQKKTALDNIADGLGLQLASQLGSMANALKHEFAIYSPATERCEVNLQLTIGPILLVAVTIVVGVLSAGIVPATVAGVVGTIGWGLGIGGAIATISGVNVQLSHASPQVIEQIKINFQTLSAFQQIIELPIQGALLSLSEDPAWIKDTYDMNRNNDTTDFIPRFLNWYHLRLNAITRVGIEVQKFFYNGFEEAARGGFFIDGARQQRFDIDEDENLMVRPGPDSVRWWVDSDGNGRRDDSDVKLVLWLRTELIPLLEELRRYGYGINADQDFNIIDTGSEPYERLIENWIDETGEFENTIVRSLYNMDFDSAVQGLDIWVKSLKTADGPYELPIDWFGSLGQLRARVIGLRNRLEVRRVQIDNCVSGCTAREGGCWDDNCEGGSACDSECCETGPCPVPDPDNPDATCCTKNCDTKWTGCCGDPLNCGRLCNDDCRPARTQKCKPPLSGERWCCDITDLEPYNNPVKGCSDNIIEVYPNRNGVRHNAIQILDRFAADLEDLRYVIGQLYDRAQNINIQSYNQMHEAFYIWRDRVGADTSNPQLVGHIAYVKVEGFDPRPRLGGGDDFKLPYPTRRVQWLPPRTCLGVGATSGEFTLTVARFDEDVAKREDMGLGRFWKFRFGRPRITETDENFVRDEAIMNNSAIGRSEYYNPSDSNKGRLRNILRNYGMVTRVRVHYGPGETQRDQKAVPAAQKNRDIYIRGTSSSM